MPDRDAGLVTGCRPWKLRLHGQRGGAAANPTVSSVLSILTGFTYS